MARLNFQACFIALTCLLATTHAFVSVRQRLAKTGLGVFEEENEWYAPPQEESEWYSPPPAPKRTGSPVETVIQSPQDLCSFIYDQDDGRLAIVKYYAAWCKSCARFSLKFNKLKSKQADQVDNSSGELVSRGQIRFASVEWGANTKLCHAQKITKLPTTRLYVDGKLVQEFTVGAKHWQRIQDAVTYHVNKQQRQQAVASESAELLEATLDKGNHLMTKVLAEQETASAVAMDGAKE